MSKDIYEQKESAKARNIDKKSTSHGRSGDPRINWFKAEFILGDEVKPTFLRRTRHKYLSGVACNNLR